jgi:ankyrin repeat protein
VYIPTYDVSTTYLFSKAEIERIFNERINYDNLLKFDQFKIRNIDRYSFKDFLRDADPDVVIHFLDKCDNLEFDWGGSWKIINYICKMSPSRVIRHLIEKEINLENACNTSKWRAIHHVASYHDGGTTRQLVSKGIDLFSKISTGETGLDIIIENQDKDTIMFTLEHIMYLTEDVIAQLLVRLTDNDNIEEMEKEDIKYMIISKLT